MHAHQDRTGLLAAGVLPQRKPVDVAEAVHVEVTLIDGAATNAKLKKLKRRTSAGRDSANGSGSGSVAAALRRVMPSISSEGAEILALHFLRLVAPDFETMTVEGLVAQCASGRVASAVVASRQFWSCSDFTFATASDPRFIEAMLTTLHAITGIDVGESQAMDIAMRDHDKRARAFAKVAFPGIDTSLLMEFFAAVTNVHESAALRERDVIDGLLGGLIESKEDLATAYNTGWVDRALDRMFCTGEISATSADSLVSAIQASLGVSGTSD